MSDPTLAELVQERIRTAYSGNQAAFSRATGIKTGTLNTIVRGKVTLPQADIRRRLARELGIPHVQFFVMAGELAEDEIKAAGVEGVVEEGPAHHLQEVVSRYDWEEEEALRLAAMIEEYAKPRDRSTTNRGKTQ